MAKLESEAVEAPAAKLEGEAVEAPAAKLVRAPTAMVVDLLLLASTTVVFAAATVKSLQQSLVNSK